MSSAVDHSTGNARIGGALQAAGYTGIFRYAAAGRASVNITPGEIDDLNDHVIKVAIVVEHGAGELLGGYDVGARHAREARDIARACGLPDGVVYLAGDSESLQDSSRNMALVGDACRGAGDIIGRDNVGFYGSYYLVDYLATHVPWIRFFWQTAAWSSGRVHPRACAYQEARQATIGGVQCDLNLLLAANWGQRGYVEPKPESKGAPMLASALNKDGRAEVFAALDDGQIRHTWQEDAGWHGEKGVAAHKWESLGHVGGTPAGITAWRNADGRLEVSVELDDGDVRHSWQEEPGRGWHGARTGVTATWESLGSVGAD